MPYCAKCGVEVENGVKNCPLCKFPIPDILSGEEKKDENIQKLKIYTEKSFKREKIKFFILFL